MPEGRTSISSSRVSTGDIARHSFAIVRRGFDEDEVKAYLQQVARSIEALEQQEQELQAAVAAANERAAHPVIDEATLTASLGQHSAQILRHAHDEAARIVVQAQEGASTLLREAQNQANEIQAHSEGASAERVAEAELMVATAEQEARAEGERIRGNAHAEGDAVVARAKDEGRALLEQVQEARKRVLGDLATRRRALSIQIEQLRAARDEMAASIHGVRDAVDGILVNLSRSDEDARSAALAAGDQARLHGTADGPEGPISSDVPEEPVGPVAAVTMVESVATVASPASPVGPVGAAGPEAAVGDDPAHEGPAPSVDELFARIRAGTDETGAPTGVVPSASAPTQAVTITPEGGVAAATSGEGAAAPAVAAGPDQPLIDRRDALLSPVTSQLARHIKRSLGDDQNRLLELLRNSPAITGAALLGPEDLHLATFVSAAQGHMANAFAAGVEFAGGAAGSAPSTTKDAAVEQSSAGLARTVVTMLRRRIEDGTDAGEEVADRVGAAFREWRGERIERLVGDFAVQAFSAGVAAATPAGAQVRWVLTTQSGCSDCDDNALAGAVAASEGFPTGHPYPPAHSGCRCLVVVAPA